MFVAINMMPIIIFYIHLLARFMTNATKEHLSYAKTPRAAHSGRRPFPGHELLHTT